MPEEFIISGWMDYGPHRDAVLGHFAAVALASRAEPGCLDYTVCGDSENPGRVVVFERWESESHLAAHFRTAHIDRFRSAIDPYPRTGRNIRRYFVSRSEDFQSSRVTADQV